MAAPAAAAAAGKAGGAKGGGAAAGGGGAAGGGAGGGRGRNPLDYQPRGRSRDDEERSGDDSGLGALWLVVTVAGLIGLLLLVIVLTFPVLVISGISGGGEATAREDSCVGVSCAALGDVPEAAEPFREIYQDAASVFRINPYLLMAVHEDETNYSRSTAQGVRDGVNFAGCCAGPMQFLIEGGASNRQGGSGGTWAGYANAYRLATINRPGNYPLQFEPHPNVYDSFDAIYAAAQYFSRLGAGYQLDGRTLDALRSYKGTPPASEPYAQHDFARARELERAGSTARGGPAVAMYAKAEEIARDAPPYTYGGGHNGAFEGPYDCSGLVSAVLNAGGFLDFPVTTAGLLTWGEPGEGRVFTVWTRGAGASGHAFLQFHYEAVFPPGTINGNLIPRSFIEANGPAGTPAGWRNNKNTAGYTPRHWRGM